MLSLNNLKLSDNLVDNDSNSRPECNGLLYRLSRLCNELGISITLEDTFLSCKICKIKSVTISESYQNTVEYDHSSLKKRNKVQ